MAEGNLILFNKPYGVISQFSGEGATLRDFIAIKGFYPAGRLDKDSEGLLLLTNDGKLQARIASPAFKMEKSYWVQIEGEPDDQALAPLRKGINLKDGRTKPARVKVIDCPLPNRVPDIRQRKDVRTSWLELAIKEGKNRQVRRMTAAAGFPTLRLFRHKIGPWTAAGLAPGAFELIRVNF